MDIDDFIFVLRSAECPFESSLSDPACVRGSLGATLYSTATDCVSYGAVAVELAKSRAGERLKGRVEAERGQQPRNEGADWFRQLSDQA